MADRGKGRERRPADAVAGRVGGDQFGVLRLIILVMAEPKYCFPTFAMNSTATNIPMKYIYFSQFLTFVILPVSYLLDIVRTALSWNDTPAEKED